MHILKNRIILSFAVILWATYFWEFYVKPITGPLYTAAVSEYKNKNYQRSLELLKQAYRIDPNDTSILTLMGWDYLKMGDAKAAEPNFSRALRLAPNGLDTILGYAYTEIALKEYEKAASLLVALRKNGVETADVHLAWGVLYRSVGRNRDAAREFDIALALRRDDPLAVKNLKELYNQTGDIRQVSLEFQPLVRPTKLTFTARVEGEHFMRFIDGAWKPVYLTGVSLTAALPGNFPVASATDAVVYADWLGKISDLGVNTIRINTILPPAFYRALHQYNRAGGHSPLWVLQGIAFEEPPGSDMFEDRYYQSCLKEIHNAVDVIHGQGDVGANHIHPGGIYPNDVAPWVTGFLVGNTWVSHVVTDNNQFHATMQNYHGTYIEVPSGSPTEIFLAQMINNVAEYEETAYNWQHPTGFLNWPTLDPIRHPTESTILEEASIRHSLGEIFPTPVGPYDDEDSVSVDPLHLHPRDRFAAGYFADYSVFPFYPDFINRDAGYQAISDDQGSNPFLGYLRDLKAHTRGIPLLISDYGIPTSLGMGHFSPAGFNEGGKTEEQQGQLLARFTRNIYDAGAAGGMIFEWLDEWFRQSWVVRNYETPSDRKPLWTNFMDPSEYFGLLAADPHGLSVHRLEGDPKEWSGRPALYTELQRGLFQPVGDRWDPARDLKALYADADEGFLYLRLVVGRLDNDNTGQVDWDKVNYLIGIGAAPGLAGLTYLPFIAPVRFPTGMTHAIQLAGPESSRIWIASAYNSYHIVPVEGIPTETLLVQKLGWKPGVTDDGSFEVHAIEPNRRRFSRDRRYFPPERYDRGILRYGTLDLKTPDYNPLAEWHVNVRTNTMDLRIPWNLLNVTDPSNFKVFAGLERDGTVLTADTAGMLLVAFSYRPLESSRSRPIMEQGHPIADALPGMTGPAAIFAAALKEYRWSKWDTPEYTLRPKESYAILRKAILSLPASSPSPHLVAQGIDQGGK